MRAVIASHVMIFYTPLLFSTFFSQVENFPSVVKVGQEAKDFPSVEKVGQEAEERPLIKYHSSFGTRYRI